MKNLLFILFLACSIQANAEITMPVTFGDGMVLQRNMPIRIFGEATDGANITVRLNGQEKIAVSQGGNWLLNLDKIPAGGPYELVIIGDGDTIRFKDVMIGEVWFAGGQSNMAFNLENCIDFEKYLPTAENPKLRFLQIPLTEFGPINTNGLQWKNFDKNTVRGFSAVAYFFATELQERLGVTVGIIGSYRGGTWNENWMTPNSIKNTPELKYLFEKYDREYAKYKDEADYEQTYQQYLIDLKNWKANGGWSSGQAPMAPAGPKAYQRPSGLYESMIKPLQPYTIKGCIWYQGEGNSSRHEEFKTLFPAFIEGWRKSWQNPELPFYFVQLPAYGKGSTWPQFRQAQLECFEKIPHCGMVVSEGCGDEKDIHLKVKKPIGDRLGIAISAVVYKQPHVPYGPQVKKVNYYKNKAKVSFDYCDNGLVLSETNIDSFEISGEDKKFRVAQIEIKGNTLYIWNNEVQRPKYIRYAYRPYPQMVLFNKEGLPASPFTTEK
jgi:sialate O-acetylesterase